MKKNNKAFALIDTVIALALIGVALIVVGVVSPANRIVRISNGYIIADSIAQTELDSLRSLGFANLINQENTSFTDTNLSKLRQSTASYTISDYDATGDGSVETDIKQITVTVTWVQNGETKSRTLSTLADKTGLIQ